MKKEQPLRQEKTRRKSISWNWVSRALCSRLGVPGLWNISSAHSFLYQLAFAGLQTTPKT